MIQSSVFYVVFVLFQVQYEDGADVYDCFRGDELGGEDTAAWRMQSLMNSGLRSTYLMFPLLISLKISFEVLADKEKR